jgi:hypothetical protein
MSLRNQIFVVAFSSLALLAGLAPAADTAPVKQVPGKDAKAAAAGSPAAAESIAQLVEQLDSADFGTREAACGKLAAKGKEAIPALEKAAANGNLEVSSRATGILGKLLDSSDKDTDDAALKSLHNLADGDSPTAARKAKSILEKKDGLKGNAQGMAMPGGGFVIPGGGFGGRIIINGGQLNIGGGAGGFGMTTMSISNVNGVKEITATEDGKSVKIHDDPTQGIKIELTEKENGKETTKKYEAKNVDELKKNSPAGYEVFKKFGGEQGNGLQMNFGALNLNTFPAIPLQPGMPAIPLQPGQAMPVLPAPPLPGAAAQAGKRQVEAASRMLKNLTARLEALQKAEAYKDATPESKAELKKQVDELSKQLEEIRGQIGDK